MRIGMGCRGLRIVVTLSQVAGLAISQPWGAMIGLLALPLLLWLASRKGRSMSYARTTFGLAYRSGIIKRKLSLTFFERIQAVRWNQSPFDRRWEMATLSVDTAGAGPANGNRYARRRPRVPARPARRSCPAQRGFGKECCRAQSFI